MPCLALPCLSVPSDCLEAPYRNSSNLHPAASIGMPCFLLALPFPPASDCLEAPYLYHFIVAGVCFLVFSAVNLVTMAADFELNPLSNSLKGARSPETEVCTARALS